MAAVQRSREPVSASRVPAHINQAAATHRPKSRLVAMTTPVINDEVSVDPCRRQMVDPSTSREVRREAAHGELRVCGTSNYWSDMVMYGPSSSYPSFR